MALLPRRVANQPMLGALLLTLLLATTAATASPVQLSSSVILFYDSEYEPHYGQPVSQCSLLLQRAVKEGSKAINIVPTHYWMSAAGGTRVKPTDPAAAKCNPDNWAETQHVHHFCSIWEWDKDCQPFDGALVRRFTEGFTKCLQEARSLFETVLISPHLDDGTNTCHWRNMLVFDPLQRDAHGFSYYDIMLAPIMSAIKAAYAGSAGRGKQVWLGLQGEMGATVFAHPRSYALAADRLRQAYYYAAAGPTASLKLAILLNHAYATGVINRSAGPKPVHPAYSKVAHLDGGLGQLLPLAKWPNSQYLAKNMAAIRQLFLQKVDIIGISNYASAPVDVQPSHMESAIAKLDAELKALGLPLRPWRARAGKRFIMCEFGLGGGSSEYGNVIAPTPAGAGRTPWLGITKTFNKALNPWASQALRDYAQAYIGALLKLLSTGGITYRVDAAFMWNMVSWDLQGLHPASSNSEGSYAVPAVAAAIRQHNKRQ